MLTYAIATLGCKVNQYESAALAATLGRAGLTEAPANTPADLVVVNTCAVTRTAMRKARQAIRKAIRTHKPSAVLLTGCYADYHGRTLIDILDEAGIPPDCRAVVGHHGDLATQLNQLLTRPKPAAQANNDRTANQANPSADAAGNDESMKADHVGSNRSAETRRQGRSPQSIRPNRMRAVKECAPGTDGLAPLETFPSHQRAFVKIQDGCDAFCAYCIVCYTRPRVRTRRLEDILAECAALVAAGHREIVLCGVFLGAFGRSTAIRRKWTQPSDALAHLVQRVAAIPGLWRVRLSSLEPGDVTPRLLEVFAETPTVASHLHLPLQSGSARILHRMNRQYTPGQFLHTVAEVRDRLDRPAITTDIIAGFPGETEDDFAATLAVARQSGFSKIHAFPFSAIEGTAAWTYRHDAPPRDITRHRLDRLAELEREMAIAYRRAFVGEQMEALVESTVTEAGLRVAMTDRYLPVTFPDGNAQPGDIVPLRITAATPTGLTAGCNT